MCATMSLMTLTKERLYSLSEIRGKLPVRRSLRTIKRWVYDGASVKSGHVERVHLEVVCVAGSLHTSIEAVERFLERLTHARRAIDAAERLRR